MRTWLVVGFVAVLGSPSRAQSIPPSEQRARTGAGTRASLAPDGPWLPVAAHAGETLEILDDTGVRVPFVERAHGVELMLHAGRSTLQDVALDGVELYPSVVAAAHGPRGDSEPGMRLALGTPIDSAAPAGRELVKVRVALGDLGDRVRLTGYARPFAVGKLYRAGDAPLTSTSSYDFTLPADYQLRAAPGGAVFAAGEHLERVIAQQLQRTGTWALVRTVEGVVGWIAVSQTEPLETPALGTELHRFVGLRGADPAATLPAGTPLYDAKDGRRVGAVSSGFLHHPVEEDAGWERFDVPTRFGTIALWAHAHATVAATASSGSGSLGTASSGSGWITPRSPAIVRVALGAPSGDFGKLSAEEIDRVVKARAGVFRVCYQRELNHTPGIGGRLVVQFQIAGDGSVPAAGTVVSANSQLHNEAVERCVKNNVDRLKFPARGTPARVTYPLMFQHGEPAGH